MATRAQFKLHTRRACPAEVLAFWHPYGYGGKSIYNGQEVFLTPANDCVKTPPQAGGKRDILCFSWREDNKGPFQDPADVCPLVLSSCALW